MHNRNPLSDKGMKLMHGIGDKYAKLLEKFQQLQVGFPAAAPTAQHH